MHRDDDEQMIVPTVAQLAQEQARVAIGVSGLQALSHYGLRVVFKHQWRSLWRWYWDALEVLAEVTLDERCPEELRQRAQGMIAREI